MVDRCYVITFIVRAVVRVIAFFALESKLCFLLLPWAGNRTSQWRGEKASPFS